MCLWKNASHIRNGYGADAIMCFTKVTTIKPLHAWHKNSSGNSVILVWPIVFCCIVALAAVAVAVSRFSWFTFIVRSANRMLVTARQINKDRQTGGEQARVGKANE